MKKIKYKFKQGDKVKVTGYIFNLDHIEEGDIGIIASYLPEQYWDKKLYWEVKFDISTCKCGYDPISLKIPEDDLALLEDQSVDAKFSLTRRIEILEQFVENLKKEMDEVRGRKKNYE